MFSYVLIIKIINAYAIHKLQIAEYITFKAKEKLGSSIHPIYLLIVHR